MVKNALIDEGKFSEITRLAAEAVAIKRRVHSE